MYRSAQGQGELHVVWLHQDFDAILHVGQCSWGSVVSQDCHQQSLQSWKLSQQGVQAHANANQDEEVNGVA
jgi:hypothetical protein